MLNRLLLTLCITSFLFSCDIENELQAELISMKLNPTFVSINQDNDVPMNVKGENVKMAVDPNQVIYAVQVYENDSAYYYGIFDETDSMKIAMITGNSYRFKIATYKVGTGLGLKQDVQTDGIYFYLPNKTLLGNKFIKGNALKDINLISSIQPATSSVKDYPEIDLFYCEKTVTAAKGLSTLDFSLLRMGFGITYNVDGLSDGKLCIFLGNDTTTLISPSATVNTIRLFNVPDNDFASVFNNANSYSDSILVKVQWVSSSGSTLNTQAKYKFTRNFQKTINIRLNTPGANLEFEDWNTVTDIDGNVYHTVKIGSQIWMVENLRVTRYNDGEPIPNITNNYDWVNLSTAGYCWYNNDIKNRDTYGAMYNGYVVTSPKLCPKGWHVPTNAEWTILTDYLGGLSAAAPKLRATGNSHWIALNNATNESGFTALPGGYRRYSDGSFLYKGNNCTFWSSTSDTDLTAWSRAMSVFDSNASQDVLVISNIKNYGISVRCIKD